MGKKIKDFKDLRLGLRVKAQPKTSKAAVKSISPECLPAPYEFSTAKETIAGTVVFIDHNSEEVHVLDPNGWIRVISFIEFFITIWPSLKYLINEFIKLFKKK